MQARRGEAASAGFVGLGPFGARMRECRPVPPAQGSAANGSPVRDSGAAMEGHATESVNFNGILVYVQLTQSSKTLRLPKSRLKAVTVWPLRSKGALCRRSRPGFTLSQ
jgi:hypothetical protein